MTLAASPAVAAPKGKAPAGQRRPDLPLAGVVTDPVLESTPGAEQMSQYYPPIAQMLELSGRARITCTVTAAGTLDDCSVDNETPLGIGFGRAAQNLAPFFRMKPMTLEGAPVAGAKWSTNIIFRLQDDSTPRPPVEAPPQARSPRALELARRLVAAMGMTDHVSQQAEARLTAIAESEDAGGGIAHPRERQAVLDAMRKAFTAGLPRYADWAARRYAADLSEADLAVIVGFAETPAGRAFNAELQDQSIWQAAAQYLWRGVRDETVRGFCAQVVCETEAASAPPAGAAPAKPPPRRPGS